VKLEAVELENRVEVDTSHGNPEPEAVEQHIKRYLVNGKVIKQCNECDFFTDRMDKATMKEHIFKHYPDVCGFACPVCRKTTKRLRGLVLHMERGHAPEVLAKHGIEFMKAYEVQFDTNSDEQMKLR
jgi:hypothetical protein